MKLATVFSGVGAPEYATRRLFRELDVVFAYDCGECRIPKGKKETSNKTFTPGPGSYKIPCRFNDINDLTRDKGIWDPTFRYV